MNTLKLLIPTRNRPNSLRSVLGYLASFYPGTAVVVADGSFGKYKEDIAAVVESAQGLDIRLASYPSDLPLVERYIDVLSTDDGALYAPSPDDDYPILGTLRQGAEIVTKRPELIGAVASYMKLTPGRNGIIKAQLKVCPDYDQPDLSDRLQLYGDYHCVTNYGVFRKSHILNRMRNFRASYVAGLADFEISFVDLVHGQMVALPDVGYIRTVNDNHSKLRRRGLKLNPWKHCAEALERLTGVIQANHPYLDRDTAMFLVDKAIARFISFKYHKAAITEAARHTIFASSPVQDQKLWFDAMFHEGSELRKMLLPNLRWAARSLFDTEIAQDNKDEQRFYETLDEMSS